MLDKELQEIADQTDELFRVLEKLWSQCRAGGASQAARRCERNGKP